MKNMLHPAMWLFLSFTAIPPINGQTVLLTEDFSGFISGNHTTPSTSDVSASLDARMSVQGWTGSLIYSAGGEIKIGTSSTTGWIETPPLDLTSYGGNCTVSFDIARWPNDAATVQVCLDGNNTGDIIAPGDAFSRIVMNLSGGTSSSRIKFKGVTKRFYIDNLTVTGDFQTSAVSLAVESSKLLIWPVPTVTVVHVRDAGKYTFAEIMDLSGKTWLKINMKELASDGIDVSGLSPGFYLMVLHSDRGVVIQKFIKR